MLHCFTFKDRYMVLDVNSSAVHIVDKPAYDVINAVISGASPYELPYKKEDIDEILAELDELKKEGALDSPELIPPKGSAPTIKSMCLHIAHDCNLRCRYCFAGTGEFHGERMMMSEEVGKKALEFLMEHSGSRHDLEVDLFGGEPLINMPVVRAVVAYGRELEKKYNKHINFTCTTNCVALTPDIMDFLNAEMHNIVISIDGRREIHDALRPTVAGGGSYDIILPKAQELIRRRGDREYYARGTFTNRNLDFTEDVRALYDAGFEQISVEPVVLPDDSPYALTAEHLGRICEEYDRLSDMVLEYRKAGHWFNFFHFMVDLENGPCLKKRVSGCGAGVEYAAVTPDGDIYPCHQFVGEKDFKMGSVLTGEFDYEKQKQFLECNILTKEECASCWAKYFCSGGCAANSYKYNGDIMKPYRLTCALEKKRTECALGIFALERGE